LRPEIDVEVADGGFSHSGASGEESVVSSE